MGEPATPTPADRRATRDLAAKIVESVRNDTAYPIDALIIGLSAFYQKKCDDLLFALAQEIGLLRSERDEALRVLNRKTGLRWDETIAARVEMGVKSLRCKECGGDGMISTTSWGETTTETCRLCNGAGEVFDEVQP